MASYVSYVTVKDIKVSKHFDPKNIEYAVRYEANAGDRFVVTYPKTGTTWTQQMIQLIVNDGNDSHPRQSFLEFSGESTVKWPVIKTHLPYEALPLHPKAKYLLVFRNPKDTCVSFYHHTVKLDKEFSGDFRQFFKLWMSGQVPSGDYFAHTLAYWQHRSDPNFRFLVYEEMKRNPREAVIKIAKFLGQNNLANDEEMVSKVIDNSTIESMREKNKALPFLTRKGQIGDWRNHMTKEESDLVDRRVEEVFANTELSWLWATDMQWQEE